MSRQKYLSHENVITKVAPISFYTHSKYFIGVRHDISYWNTINFLVKLIFQFLDGVSPHTGRSQISNELKLKKTKNTQNGQGNLESIAPPYFTTEIGFNGKDLWFRWHNSLFLIPNLTYYSQGFKIACFIFAPVTYNFKTLWLDFLFFNCLNIFVDL